MNIDDAKKSRAALKSYFVRNAIPTEQQFAQLIDGALNQRDDGVVKQAGDPLSIEAAGDATSFRKALNLYASLGDANPAWTVSLRPRANPDDPQTGRDGLSFNDPGGVSRLAIDGASGRVGVGTVTPAEALDVNGRVKAGALAIGPWPANPGPFMFVGTTNLDQRQAGNYALLQEVSNGRTYLNSPLDIRIRINNADQVVVQNDGDVGIGTSNPGAKLDVAGPVRAQNLLGRRPFRIETGQSSPTDWQVYSANGIYVDVNTSAAGFTATPRYITALHGASNHWTTAGGSSVYLPTPNSFRIYLKWVDSSPLVPANAQGNGWYIQWIGIQS